MYDKNSRNEITTTYDKVDFWKILWLFYGLKLRKSYDHKFVIITQS